jgi:3-hydroxyisobutyrate dehydrogenase
MARRLSDWPGGLTVFDVAPEASEPFSEAGNRVAASPAEVAEHASVISVMVRDDAQVRAVVTGDDGLLRAARPGTVIAIHSTVEADTPAELEVLAASSGVHVLDAPVSGGAMGAHGGTLALMVGGSAEAVALARAPMERFATLVAHLGPVGAGTRAKLARNLITFASFTAVGGGGGGGAPPPPPPASTSSSSGRWYATPTPSPAARERSCCAMMPLPSAPTTGCVPSSSTRVRSARRTSIWP